MLKEEKIKTAFLAGEFYPSEKTELEKTIENFLPKKNFQKIKSKLWGVLAPSDHYLLCGFVLGSIYSILRQTYYKTVILVSDFFGKEREEISIWSEGKWETPLGEVSVDEELAKSFLNFQKRVVFDEKIYFFDSFLEPQLPFLQKVFG
ncbi:AmmeMemoRadiSam system protein B, partial [Candidatus Parcubacteria bacterium]|nr:AmmeMemoRadiSam system protein B [Candidatus Parcubacteria bacterium]